MRQENTLTSQEKSKLNDTCEFCGISTRYLCGHKLCDSKSCIGKARRRIYEKDKNELKKYLIKIGVPPKYVEVKSDKDYKNMTNTGTYIWGSAGTGKTVLACSIAGEHILNGGEVSFYSVPKLIMQLQDSVRKDGESYYDILHKISKEEILILDDLGAEKLTDFVRQSLYFLINEREQWERTTIITSNYSLDDLDKHIDGRISSRIAGMCEVVEMTGADKRMK